MVFHLPILPHDRSPISAESNWELPDPARNLAWILGIIVVAVVVVLGAGLYALLIYQGRQVPRELLLVVSGVGQILTIAAMGFVGRQAKQNQERISTVAHTIEDGVGTKLDSHSAKLDATNEAILELLQRRTSYFERIEAELGEINRKLDSKE